MSKFLIASVPVEGHTATLPPIIEQLVARGHEVRWLAGRRYRARAEAAGAQFEPILSSTDLDGRDVMDVFPALRDVSGVRAIKIAFRDIFVGEAHGSVKDLERILDAFAADVIVANGLVFGAGIVSERRGLPLALIGDGPAQVSGPDVPPFGPGLRPWPGWPGRVRHQVLNAVTRRVFSDCDNALGDARVAHGLPREHPWIFDGMMMNARLILQGCVPEFEYPNRNMPTSLRWVGALRPGAPDSWAAPRWWHELPTDRPIVHVTQGTLRTEPGELLIPTIRALADEHVTVVLTTGDCNIDALGRLPANTYATPFIPYERMLERASAFVTNGGYIGTNLALHHGVPIVQVGRTEEKAEIGARIEHFGVGVSMRQAPDARRLRNHILRMTSDRPLRDRVQRLSAEYQRHHAPTECAEHLEHLAAVTSAKALAGLTG